MGLVVGSVYRDGAATLSKPDSGVKYFELAFNSCDLEGEVIIYSNNGSGKLPVRTATISNGKIDSELEIFRVLNDAPITRA